MDTRLVRAGDLAVQALQSGNGTAMASPDGNSIGDSFFHFKLDDRAVFQGSPTRHVRVEVDYLDQGTDSFFSTIVVSIQHPSQKVRPGAFGSRIPDGYERERSAPGV